MKTRLFTMLPVYIFLFVCGSLYGQGESVIILGGSSGWRSVDTRNGVTEASAVRPHSVLVLSSATGTSTAGYTAASGVWGNFAPLDEAALDVSISFDENNPAHYRDNSRRYTVTASGVDAVMRPHARAGTGSVLFDGNGNVRVRPQSRDALFFAGNSIRDFSIEFWLYPLNMDNGEQIFSWISTAGTNVSQRIHCFTNRNRLSWSFVNFFSFVDARTNRTSYINLEFSSRTPVHPKTWSHHLIRFDASIGLLEYIVDGSSEAIVYATATGRERSEVYTPVAGSNGVITLGERFVGLMDEFKIHEVCAGRSTIQRYPSPGGRAETRAIDLGHNNSGVLRVNASGGRINLKTRSSFNEFRENGRFRFPDDTEMSFYIRSNENPYLLNSSPWIAFTPGANISDVRGRYVQIAVDFYPSRDGETSPYLNEIKIVYLPGEPPLPPRNVTAVAVDGGVLLRWRNSPSPETAGYLIYYSTVRGELFGDDALLGASPINAGNRNSLFIEGLKNGTLYYFRVAAYDGHNTGEFSAEVTARPLAGLSLSEVTSAQ
ncbi:MAG: fibronectin type III domain-containing protein [Treponema sp.]|jgi:hypothetical protein|nr:fibronectin type III domain-containing protein [Treponema sp.]